MPSFTRVVAIATLATSALAAAIQPAVVNVADLDDASVTVYASGVPEELIPQEGVNSTLHKRGNAGVYLCVDSHFNGYCVHIVQPEYQCVNLSGDLNDKVSSLGPDNPKYCLFYGNFNCNDSEGHFGTFAPGYDDLSSRSVYNGKFNDKISSYICHPN
ncbi:hypothetical protein F4808DRAFT_472786 [Astrocystis sublimbata]|nr:hypothetical protein F4808DRAFT_472786 [Astrocystis sublimbata]